MYYGNGENFNVDKYPRGLGICTVSCTPARPARRLRAGDEKTKAWFPSVGSAGRLLTLLHVSKVVERLLLCVAFPRAFYVWKCSSSDGIQQRQGLFSIIV